MATPQTGARPAVASDDLEIRLLGDFAILHNQIPVTDLDSPRLQALLAYLILHAEAPQLRRHVAFQLWPDSTESQAQTNLRNLLHRLRRHWTPASEVFVIKNKSLQWRPPVAIRVDAIEFKGALDAADSTDSTEQAINHLRQAISIYLGDLLPSCYDEWILPERSRLRRAYLTALEELSNYLAEQWLRPEAIRYAQRLIREEPLREVGLRC